MTEFVASVRHGRGVQFSFPARPPAPVSPDAVATLLPRGQWRVAQAGEDADLGSAENDSKIFMDGLGVRRTRYARLLVNESPGA